MSRGRGEGGDTAKAFDESPADRLSAEILSRRAAGMLPPEFSNELLIQRLPVVTYINDPRGACLFISPQIEELFGFSAEEMFAEPFKFPKAIHPDDQERAYQFSARIHEHDEFDIEYRLITRSGDVKWVRDRGILVRDDDGSVAYQQGFMIDVTAEREMAERERQAQKLELAGRIAGGIAHDFNSVLTSIRGLSQILLDRLAAGDPNRRDVAAIHMSAEHAIELSKRLLSFASKHVWRREQVSLNEVIGEAVQILRPLLGGARLHLALEPDLCLVEADRGQLLQVILNLLMNARDAVAADGLVSISSTNLPGKRVAVSVSDSGAGIADEIRELIFEPFFTTKPDGQGTGLGLSTVHGIVSRAGGTVKVSSSSRGSTFTVELPCLDVVAGRPERVDLADGGGQTVLLVEDEPGVRLLVSSLLVKHGFTVIEAEDGAAAVEKLHLFDGLITFVLTDVVMPRLGGLQLAEQVELLQPGTPVVFMSGYSSDPELDRRIEQGALFIEKPFTAADLVRTLARLQLQP